MSRIRARKWIRRIGIVALGIVALPLLVLLSLTITPVRDSVAQRAVRALDTALPGKIEVQKAIWDWPARLELRGVEWTQSGERLAAIERVRVDVLIADLVSRDLVLEQVRIEKLEVDVPRIRSALAEALDRASNGAKTTRPATAQVPYLRPGALPGLPSLLVQQLAVDVPRAILSATDTLWALRVDAQGDVRAGRPPRLEVTHAEASVPSRGLRLHPGTLSVDLQNGALRADFTGQLGHGGAFTLASTSSDANAFEVLLRFPERAAEAHLQGTWDREGARPVALRFDARVEARDASSWNVAALRGWAPARVEVMGDLDLRDGVRGRSSVVVALAPAWFESATTALQFDASGFSTDSLAVRLDGLDIHGAVAIADGDLRSRLHAACTGTRWLQAFSDSLVAPDSLHLSADLEATGALEDPRMTLRARGGLRAGATRIEALELDVEAPRGMRQPVSWRARVDARALRTTLAGSLLLSRDSTVVRSELQPILVQVLDAARPRPARRAKSDVGVVTYDARQGTARVQNLRIRGDLGDFALTGRWDLVSGGHARLTVQWPEAPHMAGVADSLAQALRAAWPREFIPELRVDATIAGRAQRFRTQLDGSARLPGPGAVAAALPAALSERWELSDWRTIEARFHADIADSSFGSVDLGATTWIDSGLVEWSSRDGRYALERAKLRLEGLAVDAHVIDAGGGLSGELDVRAEDPRFLQRIRGIPDSLRVAWQGRFEVTGRRPAPFIQGELRASGHAAAWSVPALQARVELRLTERFEVEVTLPEGAVLSQSPMQIDHVGLRYATATAGGADWLKSGNLHLDVVGPDIGLRQVGFVDWREDRSVRCDSLTLRLTDRDLRNVRPFVVTQSASERLSVDDVELVGSMGRLVASVTTGPDTLALHLEAQLSVPAKPAGLILQGAAWPSRIELQAQGNSHDDVRMSASLNGFRLSAKHPLRLNVALQPAAASPENASAWPGFDVRLDLAGADTLVAASALLPLRFDQFPLHARTLDDSVRVVARWRRVPLTLGALPNDLTDYLDAEEPRPLLSGELRVSGRGAAPNVEVDAQVDLPMGRLREYRTTLRARGNGNDRTRVDLDVRRSGRPIAMGRLDAPLRYALAPVQLGLGEGDLSATLRADSLDLGELTPLLPPGSSARGKLLVSLTASGAASDPQLQGFVRLDRLDLEVSGGRSARLDFDTRVRGSVSAPDVSGTLRIAQARLASPSAKTSCPPRGVRCSGKPPIPIRRWRRNPKPQPHRYDCKYPRVPRSP